jgi:pyridoxal phosphate enzyme (YggS family)
MATIAEGLQAVRQRIVQAARLAGRDPDDIRLIAVSKTFASDAIRAAFVAGQRAFGESYLQEALPKMRELCDLPLEWHYIGPIQSNKTRPIAERFDWVHAVDRLKIAERLSAARGQAQPPLQVCVQVNITGEPTKSGVAPDEVVPLAQAIQHLPRLQLRGLMTIPRPVEGFDAQRAQFRLLRELRDRLTAAGIRIDTLSMGMTDDFEAAIAEGATIIRVGRAIFGERSRHVPADVADNNA